MDLTELCDTEAEAGTGSKQETTPSTLQPQRTEGRIDRERQQLPVVITACRYKVGGRDGTERVWAFPSPMIPP